MLADEKILTFTEAARTLPPIAGKRCHPSTICRWARKGCKGVRLEVRRLGGRFVTSIEALERFSEALAAIDLPEHPEAPAPRLPTDRQRAKSIGRAEKVLTAEGIL